MLRETQEEKNKSLLLTADKILGSQQEYNESIIKAKKLKTEAEENKIKITERDIN